MRVLDKVQDLYSVCSRDHKNSFNPLKKLTPSRHTVISVWTGKHEGDGGANKKGRRRGKGGAESIQLGALSRVPPNNGKIDLAKRSQVSAKTSIVCCDNCVRENLCDHSNGPSAQTPSLHQKESGPPIPILLRTEQHGKIML